MLYIYVFQGPAGSGKSTAALNFAGTSGFMKKSVRKGMDEELSVKESFNFFILDEATERNAKHAVNFINNMDMTRDRTIIICTQEHGVAVKVSEMLGGYPVNSCSFALYNSLPPR